MYHEYVIWKQTNTCPLQSNPYERFHFSFHLSPFQPLLQIIQDLLPLLHYCFIIQYIEEGRFIRVLRVYIQQCTFPTASGRCVSWYAKNSEDECSRGDESFTISGLRVELQNNSNKSSLLQKCYIGERWGRKEERKERKEQLKKDDEKKLDKRTFQNHFSISLPSIDNYFG